MIRLLCFIGDVFMTQFLSLESALNHCEDFWNLTIVDDAIAEASPLEAFFEWVRSFFSSSHLNNLKGKIFKILNSETLCATSEKETSILEKLAMVISKYSLSWLHGINSKLNQPRQIETENSFEETENLLTPIKENGRFVNFLGEDLWNGFLETVKLFFPGMLSLSTHLESVEELCQREEITARSIDPVYTWLGHSTVLIQLAGLNLLFDPTFGFCPPCFPRHTKPGIELKDLPLIDVVFVSHNHYDHCEPKAIDHLSKYQPIALAPEGFKSFFKERRYENAHDLKWWQKTMFKIDERQVAITSVPAFHNSQTTLFDMNKSHWHGAVIEYEGQKIYFAGDTAYKEDLFHQLKAKYGCFDMVFMPIAPEGEDRVHVNAENALKAFRILDAKQMIPIHYGAYRQSKETLEDPKKRIESFLEGDFSDLKDRVYFAKIGQRSYITPLQKLEQAK